MAEVKANINADHIQKLVAEHMKCTDYLSECTKKLKPYRDRLKKTKEELTQLIEHLPQKVIQVDDEYLRLECRNRRLPLSKGRLEMKIKEFFVSQPDIGESLWEYLNREEYEPVNALRKRKGIFKEESEQELDFSELGERGDEDDDEDDD